MIDVLIDYNNNTMFKNGDLNVGFCDEQNKRLLLVSEKASFKEFPASCVGLVFYLESEDISAMLREVRSEFVGDGMRVDQITFDDLNLVTSAEYVGKPITNQKSLNNAPLDGSLNENVIVGAGQTLIDITLQELGDEERIFEMADANNCGITDDLTAGVHLNSLLVDTDKISIVKVLQQRKPSSLYYGTGDPAPDGIGYWGIEIDFIVS
jgi:hypothetical protein